MDWITEQLNVIVAIWVAVFVIVFLGLSFLIYATFARLAASGLIHSHRRGSRFLPHRALALHAATLGLLPAIIFVAFLILYTWLAKQLFNLIMDASTHSWLVGVSIAVGYLLYVFRTKRRTAYGITEIVVGITTVWFSALDASQGPNIGHLVATLGGIYIIVRGLDNVDNGMDDFCRRLPRGIGPEVQKLWKRFRWDLSKPLQT